MALHNVMCPLQRIFASNHFLGSVRAHSEQPARSEENQYMSHRFQNRLLVTGIIAAVALMLTADAVWADEKPAFGTITKLATVPAAPGFPEGVAIHGDSVFVSGPARFGTAGTGPSAIQVYDRDSGELEQTIVVQGEALTFEHALSNLAIIVKAVCMRSARSSV
jgi:hypothetical protein